MSRKAKPYAVRLRIFDSRTPSEPIADTHPESLSAFAVSAEHVVAGLASVAAHTAALIREFHGAEPLEASEHVLMSRLGSLRTSLSTGRGHTTWQGSYMVAGVVHTWRAYITSHVPLESFPALIPSYYAPVTTIYLPDGTVSVVDPIAEAREAMLGPSPRLTPRPEAPATAEDVERHAEALRAFAERDRTRAGRALELDAEDAETDAED